MTDTLDRPSVHTEALIKLGDELRLAQLGSGVARERFTELFVAALNILELDSDQAAKLFKISRLTVGRWTNGVSAPHSLGRVPVFQVLEQKIADKLSLYTKGGK